MIELPTELRERTSKNLARNRTKSGFRQCLKKKGKKKKRKKERKITALEFLSFSRGRAIENFSTVQFSSTHVRRRNKLARDPERKKFNYKKIRHLSMIIMQFLFRFVNISFSCFPFTFPSMSNFTVNIEIPPPPRISFKCHSLE